MAKKVVTASIIEWVDSASLGHGWNRKDFKDMKLKSVFSAGIILDADEERIIMTHSYHPEGNVHHDLFMIPVSAIKSRKDFEVGSE